jgi:hypothetical protein
MNDDVRVAVMKCGHLYVYPKKLYGADYRNEDRSCRFCSPIVITFSEITRYDTTRRILYGKKEEWLP